jgi:hypothetical protein
MVQKGMVLKEFQEINSLHSSKSAYTVGMYNHSFKNLVMWGDFGEN